MPLLLLTIGMYTYFSFDSDGVQLLLFSIDKLPIAFFFFLVPFLFFFFFLLSFVFFLLNSKSDATAVMLLTIDMCVCIYIFKNYISENCLIGFPI